MTYRFWSRIKIVLGVTLNLSKSGRSLSFGSRGAKITIGQRGILGPGLFYMITLPSVRSDGRRDIPFVAPAYEDLKQKSRARA